MRSHAEVAAPLDAGLLQRIRSEYLEMPGLQLSLWQASRLWNLDFNTCRRILGRLTAEGFLRRLPDGTYSCQCHGSH